MRENIDPFKEYEEYLKNKEAEKLDTSQGFFEVPNQEKAPKEESFSHEENAGEEFLSIKKRKIKKPRERRGIFPTLMVLGIVLPIFLIANFFIATYLYTVQEQRFQAQIDEAVSTLEDSFYDQITYNADLAAYYVAEKCLDQVMEITSVSSQTGISSGTGFIISADGYVLTNAHVVTYSKALGGGEYQDTAAETIYLRYADNSYTYEAECVAFDTTIDLAVLKIKNPPQDLNVAEFANSVNVEYGEPCIAIGNAKSKGLSVTDGVVSSPMVNFYFTTSFVTAAIQHTAPINSGNSGGPLYNMFGQVIGINTFKLESSEGTEGMGYAMPSVIMKDWVNSLGISGLSISFAETPTLGGVE